MTNLQSYELEGVKPLHYPGPALLLHCKRVEFIGQFGTNGEAIVENLVSSPAFEPCNSKESSVTDRLDQDPASSRAALRHTRRCR